MSSFGEVRQHQLRYLNLCFAPDDRVGHGLAFSIIGVTKAPELILGTLYYSLRSPSSSVAGSSPTSLSDLV